MAGTTEKFINLKNTRLTMGSGLIVDCINIRIKRNPIYIDRTAGMAWTEQSVYNGENKPDIMIEGFNSDDLSFGEIIPNDPVVAFSVMGTETGTPSRLQSDFLTKWPLSGMVFGETETDFTGKDCSTWRIPIVAGVLNPNPVEGEGD